MGEEKGKQERCHGEVPCGVRESSPLTAAEIGAHLVISADVTHPATGDEGGNAAP